ncbi:MAG TPA: AAA family ATPase [Candidatus Limnocylindrales bacterium]|nr:AAA family ATPase [Candidatus Limnocylindrales bacterium]
MGRQAIVVALPRDEQIAVIKELTEAGFDALAVTTPEELEAIFNSRREVGVAILDGESDFDRSLEFYSLLHDADRAVPALMVVSPRALDRLAGAATKADINDEFFTRPYSTDSLRWRIEAMLIRSVTIDDGSGPILQSGGDFESESWSKRATIVSIFNPKGGVGKTTTALNLAAALQVRMGLKVMLIDADTVTGHIATSLGLESVTTVVDAWTEDVEEGRSERSLIDIATQHQNGLTVCVLTATPLNTEILVPERVGEAIRAARRGFDFIIVDMHPSYSPLNQEIFERSDRILVPVTPDVPALRAAVQMRDVAQELGVRDKLALVVNRANSGVSVADMEKTVGMPALALIRSGGLLFVRAANEGRSVVEQYPKEKVTEDFEVLAQKLVGTEIQVTDKAAAAKPSFRLFNRTKEPARA